MTYEMDRDMQPIIDGKVPLPNAEPIDSDVGAAVLHYRVMRAGHALMPNGRTEWNARFFLDCGQGGQLEGSGIVAWSAWKDGAYRATGLRFAICKHEKKDDPGADHQRGWHPGRCVKCGLDMTVDSGD
jgi:hypothetical protein